ncbi:MAG: ferredoxin--NADP reductase [Saprospiraceae bacterium]|nr:ferredoxin--NADP reductase [Saprospiraceae bacterium]MDZ4705414.1 ferredoxin--NADP reductase [Saprospiraceae bacterium]
MNRSDYRRLRVVEKHPETTDVYTFVLEPADGLPYPYESGQFATLIFEVNGKERRRAYSFSSAPGHDGLPAITVKRVANGEFSNYLIRNVHPGDELETLDALGQFTLKQVRLADRQLFFVAGGSGITPVFSLLKTLLHQEQAPFITLFYTNQSAAHTIFKTSIDAWIARFPDRFQCIYLFSSERHPDRPHLHAHLNNGLLEALVAQYALFPPEALNFFLCAPEALMRMAEITLRYLGLDETQIHKEVFTVKPTDAHFLPEINPAIHHRITVSGKKYNAEFEVFEGETILDGALRQGIILPYNCKAGVCTACTAQCTAGTVKMRYNGSQRIGKAGEFVYTCIGYAESERVDLKF